MGTDFASDCDTEFQPHSASNPNGDLTPMTEHFTAPTAVRRGAASPLARSAWRLIRSPQVTVPDVKKAGPGKSGQDLTSVPESSTPYTAAPWLLSLFSTRNHMITRHQMMSWLAMCSIFPVYQHVIAASDDDAKCMDTPLNPA